MSSKMLASILAAEDERDREKYLEERKKAKKVKTKKAKSKKQNTKHPLSDPPDRSLVGAKKQKAIPVPVTPESKPKTKKPKTKKPNTKHPLSDRSDRSLTGVKKRKADPVPATPESKPSIISSMAVQDLEVMAVEQLEMMEVQQSRKHAALPVPDTPVSKLGVSSMTFPVPITPDSKPNVSSVASQEPEEEALEQELSPQNKSLVESFWKHTPQPQLIYSGKGYRDQQFRELQSLMIPDFITDYHVPTVPRKAHINRVAMHNMAISSESALAMSVLFVAAMVADLLDVINSPKLSNQGKQKTRVTVMTCNILIMIGRSTQRMSLTGSNTWMSNTMLGRGSVYRKDPRKSGKPKWLKHMYASFYVPLIKYVAPEWAGDHEDFIIQTACYGEYAGESGKGGKCDWHIDKGDISWQYLFGFGDYSGGCLEVKTASGRVAKIDIRYKIVKMDGRFMHRVTPWKGKRNSIIWFKGFDRRYKKADELDGTITCVWPKYEVLYAPPK